MPIAVRSKGAPASAESPYDQSGATLNLRRPREKLLERQVGRREARGRRQPRLVLLGLALVVTCAALGGELVRKNTRETSYLVVSQDVPAGDLVQADDLATVALSSPSGISAIPAADGSEVVGRRVAETVVAGSLLVAGDLLRGSTPGPGAALVGTSLQPDQVPSSLQIGDSVVIVLSGTAGSSVNAETAPTTAGASSAASQLGANAVVLGRGTVYAFEGGGSSAAGSSASNSSGEANVTISVPSASASVIAAASAAGDVSLVEVPPSVPITSGTRQ